MILFLLGIVIGSIGGLIMMAIFLTGKNRESSFDERISMRRQPNTGTTGPAKDSVEKR